MPLKPTNQPTNLLAYKSYAKKKQNKRFYIMWPRMVDMPLNKIINQLAQQFAYKSYLKNVAVNNPQDLLCH